MRPGVDVSGVGCDALSAPGWFDVADPPAPLSVLANRAFALQERNA